MRFFLIFFSFFFIISYANAQNPFEAYGYTPKIATLSNGKYNEFHDLDTIVQIGSVLFNTKSKQIIAFLQIDTLYSEATLQPDIVSIWLSPDPLSDENQGISPYNYCHWNPIVIIDLDGRDDNDPYWQDNITKQIVYTDHDGPPTTIKGDWKYKGETITGTDASGNTVYGDQYGKFHTSSSLPVVNITDNKFKYDGSAAANAFVDGFEKTLFYLTVGVVAGEFISNILIGINAVNNIDDQLEENSTIVPTEDGSTTDLQPTINRINSGEKYPHGNDGSVFQNYPPKGQSEPLLPVKPKGYYNEYVHPTPGVNAPGSMRIVTGKNGEIWFTPNHYKSFIRIK